MNHTLRPGRALFVLAVCVPLAGWGFGCARTSGTTAAERNASTAAAKAPAKQAGAEAKVAIDPAIAAIRDEGLNRSQVMDTLDHLTNVIGPRLTASPAARQANEWARDRLASWGLANAHVEEWGPFGRGWTVRRFSMQVTQPYTIALTGYPKGWSPGFEAPFEADVVRVDAKAEADLEKYKGQLAGKVVLLGPTREVQARFEPMASRLSDEQLERLAKMEVGGEALLAQPRTVTPPERQAQFAAAGGAVERLMNRRGETTPTAAAGGGGGDASSNGDAPRAARAPGDQPPTTGPATRPARRGGGGGGFAFASRLLQFAADEGAVVIVTASPKGDGGTFFVTGASIPGENPFGGAGPTTAPTTGPATAPATAPAARPRVWSFDAPKFPAQVLLAIEDYNRLARLLAQGQSVRVGVDLQVEYHDQDKGMSWNTIAEIPGTDKADEIVMVGAHIDSWHAGAGATDNAAGTAAAMEAVRIIRALDLKPRRTIRVGLWTGEEQGLHGSAAYAKKHLGHDPDAETRRAADRARRAAAAAAAAEAGEPGEPAAPATQPATARKLVKGPGYEKFSVYFNMDNGTGKIRGVYAQGNAAAVPIFAEWLKPFADLGAKTVTISNTGSTDHMSFDAIGLPGFQFIQDPMEYSSRTHHSNQDVFDRLQPDDLKQASTIMAAFVWNAANMDELFPRKPQPAAGR